MALPRSHPWKIGVFCTIVNITFSYLIDFQNRYLSCQRKIDSTGMLVNLNVKRDKSLTSGNFFHNLTFFSTKMSERDGIPSDFRPDQNRISLRSVPVLCGMQGSQCRAPSSFDRSSTEHAHSPFFRSEKIM